MVVVVLLCFMVAVVFFCFMLAVFCLFGSVVCLTVFVWGYVLLLCSGVCVCFGGRFFCVLWFVLFCVVLSNNPQ